MWGRIVCLAFASAAGARRRGPEILRPEVDADARHDGTEAQAAAARVIAHQAHGAVLGRTARERRIHLVADWDAAIDHEGVERRLVLKREGRAIDAHGEARNQSRFLAHGLAVDVLDRDEADVRTVSFVLGRERGVNEAARLAKSVRVSLIEPVWKSDVAIDARIDGRIIQLADTLEDASAGS